MTTVLLVTFLVLLLLDVPVAFCMMLAALAAFLYSGVDPIMVGLEVSRSMASWPRLASSSGSVPAFFSASIN